MKNKKKKVIKSAAAVTMIAATMSLTSCEFMAAFAEGMAQGMAGYNYYNPYGYGSYNSLTSSYPSYSLDPNVIWNQAVQEVAQQQQELNNIAVQTLNNACAKVERQQQELHDNIKNTKKMDGSEFTEAEIQQIMFNANTAYVNEMKGINNSSNPSSNQSGSSQYEDMYRRYEKSVQDWFNGLTINGSKGTDSHGNINGTVNSSHYTNGGTYSSAQTGMKNAQKEMRRIREEAAQYGVFIQQSKWETATAGY